MTSDLVILSVDLGTSGIKTALITSHGKVLGWEYEAVPLYLTPDGGAEQSPAEWWQAFLTHLETADRSGTNRQGKYQGGLLLHPGRRDHPGGSSRLSPHELHPLDGHAWRAIPGKAV